MNEHSQALLAEAFEMDDLPLGEALRALTVMAVTAKPCSKAGSSSARRGKGVRAAELPSEVIPTRGGGSPRKTVMHIPEWSIQVNTSVMEESHSLDMLRHLHTPRDMTDMRAKPFEVKALRAAQCLSGVSFISLVIPLTPTS